MSLGPKWKLYRTKPFTRRYYLAGNVKVIQEFFDLNPIDSHVEKMNMQVEAWAYDGPEQDRHLHLMSMAPVLQHLRTRSLAGL